MSHRSDPDHVLQAVRAFRDRGLSQSDDGKRLIAAYYEQGPEVCRQLLTDPELARELVALLVRLQPALASTADTIVVERDLYAAGLQLLDRLGRDASQELQSALDDARAFVRNRETIVHDTVSIDLRNLATVPVIVDASAPNLP